ncbi:MAG: hypothetical protein O3A25_18310 [Acidobacteria bacterium]|nr:hypothetical protein [Acidobacteriota bacterium]
MAFQATISASTGALVRDLGGDALPDASGKREAVCDFVRSQCEGVPDYLRLPVKIAAVLFEYSAVLVAGRRFHNLPHDKQIRHIRAWCNSNLLPEPHAVL